MAREDDFGMNDQTTTFKKQAAARAVEFVESGMILGLGHGSTALFAVQRLAELLNSGELKDIVGIACSLAMEDEARALGIPLSTLQDHPVIDITIDGADEVDPNLDVIKGGGGALTREKIVAQASRREIIAVDESKLSPILGTRWAVPIEVVPFGWRPQAEFLESLGAEVELRTNDDGTVFETDQGNFILDANFGQIRVPAELAEKLNRRVGIVEHGLFVGLAADVIVAGSSGVKQLTRSG
jgi:ribose 5-phosphate isomerase A